MVYNSYLEIDTKKLIQNAKIILKELDGKAKLIPVLKGDAYGLGAKEIAKVLLGIDKIDTVAVSHLCEGIELRKNNIDCDIIVMSLVLDDQAEEGIKNDLILTIGRIEQIRNYAKLSKKYNKKVKVQIKLDTGLHRIGFPIEVLEDVADEFNKNIDCFEIVGTFSHFSNSSSESECDKQYLLFNKMVNLLESKDIKTGMKSIAASAATERTNKYNLDAVRIGRRLYMDNPNEPKGNIKEVVSYRTYIFDIKNMKKGQTLGYGGKFILDEDKTVAVIGIGYGDGLDKNLVKINAPVLVSGKRAKLLADCMDQGFIDVTNIKCNIGDEVTLFGYDKKDNFLSSQYVANLVGDDEGCGLTDALSSRVERRYI